MLTDDQGKISVCCHACSCSKYGPPPKDHAMADYITSSIHKAHLPDRESHLFTPSSFISILFSLPLVHRNDITVLKGIQFFWYNLEDISSVLQGASSLA